MLLRRISQRISEIGINQVDFPRQPIAIVQHFELKKQNARVISSIHMPLFRLEILEFSKNIITEGAQDRLKKRFPENNLNIMFCSWSNTEKRINTWKLTKQLREQMLDTLGLVASPKRCYQFHYHFLPASSCDPHIMMEQVLGALKHTRSLDEFAMGKLQNTPLKSITQQQALPIEFPFVGSGNLCDILHSKMPTDVKHWIHYCRSNHLIPVKGNYDEGRLNFRVSCSYFLFSCNKRDIVYKDFKRIQDLNSKVFNFLAFFEVATNDEAHQEFYARRFFNQLEFESKESEKLLNALVKQYSLSQLVDWIDLLVLTYEESYMNHTNSKS